jgi:hypothetical protein
MLKISAQPETSGDTIQQQVQNTNAIISYTFLLQMHCGKNLTRRIRENTRRRREDAVPAVLRNSTPLTSR